MTINASQFAKQIVIPTLQVLEQQAGIPYSEVAYYLVMGTIANESLLGTFLVQEQGPALGIGQIEPESLTSLMGRLSNKEATVLASLGSLAMTPAHNVVGNLPYAVALVRLFYWHVPHPLPSAVTITAVYEYYKQWYNTPAGAATLGVFVQNWALTGIELPVS